MLHLNLDTMVETLGALQRERQHLEVALVESDDPAFEMRMRARVDRLNKACATLADKLVEAVEEMP